MNARLFMTGICCAGAGLILTQATRDGNHLPHWVGVTNLILLMGWIVFTALSFIIKESK